MCLNCIAETHLNCIELRDKGQCLSLKAKVECVKVVRIVLDDTQAMVRDMELEGLI